MKVVWHFYANQVNMGDWASALGIRQFLSAELSDQIQFVDRFLSDEITDDNVTEMNEVANMVVVGGGGLWFRKDFPLGWYWNIKREQLHALRCPIVLYAVGLNDIEYGRPKQWSLDERGINGILDVVRRAALVGVRDYWTLEWLKHLNTGDPQLVPCPSMFLDLDFEENLVQNDVIGVNIAPPTRIRSANLFYDMMGRLLRWLSAEGFRLRYLCHAAQADEGILRLQKLYPGDIVLPRNPIELLKAYSSVRAVIGMRAHSILFSFNRDVPIFTISYSKKCEELLKLLGIQQYSTRWAPSSPWFTSPFVQRQIQSRLKKMIAGPSEFQSHWNRFRSDYRRHNEVFAHQIAQLL